MGKNFENLSQGRVALEGASTILRKAWRIGWKVALVLVIPFAAGALVDDVGGYWPWFSLAGLGVGVLLGTVVVVRETLGLIREAEIENAPEEDQQEE